MIFHIVETVLNSQVGLFIIGCGLTIAPALGIMYIHQNKGE
jgi:hypothetical protein